MATPIENVTRLTNYWKLANTNEAITTVAVAKNTGVSVLSYAQQLAGAMVAMRELCAAAAANQFTRLSVFANNAIFETALLGQDGKITEPLLQIATNGGGLDTTRITLLAADRALRSPRQIMLDAIYDAGTGGLFSPQDPSGVTSWLKSTQVAAAAMSAVIQNDPQAPVRAALLRIIRDLAFPVEVAQILKGQRAFEALVELLVSSKFPVEVRSALKKLATEADARITRDLANLAGALPTFGMGDGMQVQTLPPALAWYKQPMFAGVSLIGTILGGALAARVRR